MYKLPRGGGTGDVGFAGFRWQRPMHEEDSSHLSQSGETRIKLDEPFRLDHNMANAMEDAFYNRWTVVRTDLHYAGALLHPYLLPDKELADDNDSLIVYKKVLRKLCPLETYPDVVQDFLAFRHK
jgi:hypothetical protein